MFSRCKTKSGHSTSSYIQLITSSKRLIIFLLFNFKLAVNSPFSMDKSFSSATQLFISSGRETLELISFIKVLTDSMAIDESSNHNRELQYGFPSPINIPSATPGISLSMDSTFRGLIVFP